MTTLNSNPLLQITVILLVSLSFILSACKDETIVQNPPANDQSLIDPAVQPKIIFSYPSDNSIGPFRIHNTHESLPYFILEFNKRIPLSKKILWPITVSGFDHDVTVSMFSAYSTARPSDNVVDLKIAYKNTSFGSPQFTIGRTYTVKVDSGIVDINGNHTAQAYSFSFTPEPYFRIVASTPASGESLGVFQYVTLYVNSKVDTNIISKIHITPPVEGHWDLGFGDSLQIQFTPTGTFLNNLHYIFTIDKGAMDIAGNQMQVDNSVAFPTPSFHVKSTYPSDGNTNVYLSSGVTTRFNGPIDSATVPAAFSINPQLAGTFTYSITASISDFTNYIADFAFYPSSDFAPSTTYTVRVFSSLQSIDGTSIGQDYVFSFTTGDFAVYYWYPGYISSVSRSEKPHFYFTGRLDTASVRTAFSITPAVTGRIEFSSGDSFSFVPDSLLESHTEYTIIISTDLKSIGGYHLSKDNFYNFTTGS